MDFLADEILLQIFKYLTPYDLLDVVKVYPRHETLLDEKTLWTWIDSRRRKTSSDLAEFFYEKVYDATKAFMMIAMNEEVTITKEQILKWENYDNLTVLALENMQFDGDAFILGNFPHNLEELSLNQSHFTNYYKFFRFCSRQLSKLRVLTLEYCLSLEDSILSPLGNLESLEILSLYGCMSMKDAVVPLTMGYEYGFKKLKVLDVRCTGFGDDLLRYTSKMTQLGELYFHCYFDYIIEKKFRGRQGQEDFHEAVGKMLNFREVDISMLDYNTLRARIVMNYFQQFTNSGLLNYRKSCYRPEGYEAPKSILYERPYGTCKCKTTRPSTPHPVHNGYLQEGEDNAQITPSCSSIDLSTNLSPTSTCSPTPGTSTRKRTHDEDDDDNQSAHAPAKRLKQCMVFKCFNHPPCTIIFDPIFEFRDGSMIRPQKQAQQPNRVFQMSRVITLRPLERLQSMQRMEEEAGQDLVVLQDRDAGDIGLNRVRQHGEASPRITIRVNRVAVGDDDVVRLRDPNGMICCERINHSAFERQHFIPLTALSLRGSKNINDEGLKSLQQLQLDLLDVTGTMVTREGLLSLKKAMPTCRIIHETMCRCKPR